MPIKHVTKKPTDTLYICNQVALAMALCNGATKENAKEIAETYSMKDIMECVNLLASKAKENESCKITICI